MELLLWIMAVILKTFIGTIGFVYGLYKGLKTKTYKEWFLENAIVIDEAGNVLCK